MTQSTARIPLDEVRLTHKEWLRLSENFDRRNPNEWNILKYLVHPALPFYRLSLTGENGIPDIVVDYLPPQYCGVREFPLKGSLHADVIVAVHIYGMGVPSDGIICLGAVRDGSSEYNCFSDLVVKRPEALMPGMAEGLAWMGFCAIQDTMINRPTIFHTQLSRRCETGGSCSENRKKHKVKNFKVITIVPDALAAMESNVRKHEITCPCWGVMGHWRYYKKSGRRIWIDAYSKGKCRANPEAYKAKEYQIMTKESLHHA